MLQSGGDACGAHSSKTGLRRLYNGRGLSASSDCASPICVLSRRARDHLSLPICKRALGRRVAAHPGSKQLPVLPRTPHIPCSRCIQTITTMHWNYRWLTVKLKTQATSCNSAGGMDKPLRGSAQGGRSGRKTTNSQKAKRKKGDSMRKLSKWRYALLPVALACSQAHAQSSVTLYGVVDESIHYMTNANKAGDSSVALGNGGLTQSRWGLKGVEDLGAAGRPFSSSRIDSTLTTAKAIPRCRISMRLRLEYARARMVRSS